MTAELDAPFAPLALVADPSDSSEPSGPDGPTPNAFAPDGAAGGYRGLKLWQRGVDVAAEAHRLARAFPPGEQESIGGDLRRAAAAVPAYVAAGSLTHDRGEHLRALQAALTAVARLEAVAAVAQRLGFLTAQDNVALLVGSADVTRLLRVLVRTVGGPAREGAPAGTAVVAESPPHTDAELAPAPPPSIGRRGGARRRAPSGGRG